MPLTLHPLFYPKARDWGLPAGFEANAPSREGILSPVETQLASSQQRRAAGDGPSLVSIRKTLPQLLKEQTDRFNPAMEIRNVELLVRSMQIIVRKPEAHHYRWNLQHVLKIGHDRNRPARTNKHGLFPERITQCLSRRLDESVVGAHHACRALAPNLDLDVDPLGRVFLVDRRVALQHVVQLLVRYQPHGNFCRRLPCNHRLLPPSHTPTLHAVHLQRWTRPRPVEH